MSILEHSLIGISLILAGLLVLLLRLEHLSKGVFHANVIMSGILAALLDDLEDLDDDPRNDLEEEYHS